MMNSEWMCVTICLNSFFGNLATNYFAPSHQPLDKLHILCPYFIKNPYRTDFFIIIILFLSSFLFLFLLLLVVVLVLLLLLYYYQASRMDGADQHPIRRCPGDGVDSTHLGRTRAFLTRGTRTNPILRTV